MVPTFPLLQIVGDRLTNTFKKKFCVWTTNTYSEVIRETPPEIMDGYLSTARDLELEVNEGEILNEEHQETKRNVSLFEQEEDERGPMPKKIF
ncbi:hypothetical protein TNCV_3795201 [Trichonephila clavipes]|nr:hypothetical protein TNCV_3795201 [Trichonephila clavipes]